MNNSQCGAKVEETVGGKRRVNLVRYRGVCLPENIGTMNDNMPAIH